MAKSRQRLEVWEQLHAKIMLPQSDLAYKETPWDEEEFDRQSSLTKQMLKHAGMAGGKEYKEFGNLHQWIGKVQVVDWLESIIRNKGFPIIHTSYHPLSSSSN